MPGRRSSLLALATAMAAALAACGSGRSSPSVARDATLRVVTTVSPITSIASAVAGRFAHVRGLVPEGADSHTFEPPPSAAAVLSQADVVFVNGLRLEDPTRDLATKNLKKGGEVIELGTNTIKPDQYVYDFSFPKEGGKPNPHLWTNPPYARRYAEVIASTLSRRDPAHASAFRSNFDRFAAREDELDSAMKAATATLPPERRVLLTYHDAYAYFAQHYGWTVLGAIQVSNFEDPTPREVAALIDQIKAQKVPAIFGSEVFPSKVLSQIGKETGVRYVDKLRDDDLPGKPGDPEHSWLGLMRDDFVTMVTSLRGDASALEKIKVDDGSHDPAEYPQ